MKPLNRTLIPLLVLLIAGCESSHRPWQSKIPEQHSLERIQQMPNLPQPFKIIDWHKKARAFDSLAFDTTIKGNYWPLVWTGKSPKDNHPPHWGIYTALGDARQGKNSNNGLFHESLATMGAVLGASLIGIDKSKQHGLNYVAMLKNYFSDETGWNIMMNNITAEVASLGGGYGRDWWYDIFPNLLFYAIADLYPDEPGFDKIMCSIADKFYQADSVLNGDYAHSYFDYANLQAKDSWICAQQDAAAGHAYLLYLAYKKFGNEKYLYGAQSALQALLSQTENHFYEILMPFGAYVAARMNAEEDTNYNIAKILQWTFNGDAVCREGWGVLTGNWNGVDISGLAGSTKDRGGYAFLMNSFDMAWPLVSMLRYDALWAEAIGKWMLNLANAARFFYPDEIADEHQTLPALKAQAKGIIAYEGLIKKSSYKTPHPLKAPVAQGDGPLWIENNPPASQYSVYGSAHVGILGAMLEKTNIEGILKINVLATDFYSPKAYPTYLYFNPYKFDKIVEIRVGNKRVHLYDLVQQKIIKNNAKGKTNFLLPAGKAALISLIPASGKIRFEEGKMLVDGIVVDYHK